MINLMADRQLVLNNHLVTLNLFQGPSGGTLSSLRRGVLVASLRAAQSSGRGAKWTLKQVQGDEFGFGIA